MALRHIEKFVPALLGSPYTFSRYHYEWQPSSPLRLRTSVVVGASYAYNHVPGVPLRDVAHESVRFILDSFDTRQALEDEIDAMRSRLLLGAEGTIWMLNDDGTRRWARAQIEALPEMTLGYRPWQRVAVEARFARFTDWQGETLQHHVATITASGQTFGVTNPGNIPQPFVVVRLRANTSTGFGGSPALTIHNMTNGYKIQTNRDAASANSEVRIDTEEPVIEYSNTDGAPYADDFANLVIQPAPYRYPPLALQVEPATNTFEIISGGTVRLDAEVDLYGAYA